jgi:hypothetical protein
MQISFFQEWVTFYPPKDQPVLTIKLVDAISYLYPSFNENGISIPDPLPPSAGGGVETKTYKITMDGNIWEEMVTDNAKRIYDNYHLYKAIENRKYIKA